MSTDEGKTAGRAMDADARATPFRGGPLRTAADFRDALARADVIQNDEAAEFEYARISAAVRAAPFLVQGGRIVAKGFVPRLVAG